MTQWYLSITFKILTNSRADRAKGGKLEREFVKSTADQEAGSTRKHEHPAHSWSGNQRIPELVQEFKWNLCYESPT